MILELRDFIRDHPWPDHIKGDPLVTFHFKIIRSTSGKLEISLLDAFYYDLWKLHFLDMKVLPSSELERLKQSVQKIYENENWTRSKRQTE